MKKHNISDSYNKPIVLALGFFDCVHLGHKSIIDEAARLAGRLKAETAITTFVNDPGECLNSKQGQIYTFEERCHALANLGVRNVIYAQFDEDFASWPPEKFLDTLFSGFFIRALVVGKDFTFGKDGEGNVAYLKSYAEKRGVRVRVMPFSRLNSKKLSSSMLKRMLAAGDVAHMNPVLSEPYFQLGKIIHSHNRGSILGYPTANLSLHPDAMRLGPGIYATKTIIDGKSYIGGTNVGAKPTFGETDYSIETFLLDFNRNIYGKDVKLIFYAKLRDLARFNSVPALQRQLAQDEKNVRAYFSENGARPMSENTDKRI